MFLIEKNYYFEELEYGEKILKKINLEYYCQRINLILKKLLN